MTLWSLNFDHTAGSDEFNDAWNAFYSYHECSDGNKGNGTCATEKCLLTWFEKNAPGLSPNYEEYFNGCKPEFCDVVYMKSVVTRVVELLSTMGGLWNPLFLGAVLIWKALAMLPCLAVAAVAVAKPAASNMAQAPV